jgi:hypothetical protein
MKQCPSTKFAFIWSAITIINGLRTDRDNLNDVDTKHATTHRPYFVINNIKRGTITNYAQNIVS